MDDKIIIKIATDFNVYPGARYKADGEFSGEAFYEDLFKSKFQSACDENKILVLDLDGTWGYASSFISEIFTRMVKDFGKEKIKAHLEIKSEEEPLLKDKINRIIDEIQED